MKKLVNKPSICFVALNAYGALASVDTGHIGGIERQQSLMALWLAQTGYKVSMVTWDEGQDDAVDVRGVRVFKICGRTDGIRGLRFFHPRWSSLVLAMKRANADIYYYNCGDLGLGQIVFWAHKNRKKVIYSVASDPDCNPALPVLKPLRERILYRYGLTHADHIIVQTKSQQHMLKQGFDLESTLIPMPCAGFHGERPTTQDKKRILWVGRISVEKRLEWLLDVAELCPDLIFDVIGTSNTGSDYSLQLVNRAEKMANVIMHGRMQHDEIERFYLQATALCCTSAYEGFPNTFLESFSTGLPIVSTFDPDDIIAQNGLGKVVKTRQEQAKALTELATTNSIWQHNASSAKKYFNDKHKLETTMPMFENIFQQVVTI